MTRHELYQLAASIMMAADRLETQGSLKVGECELLENWLVRGEFAPSVITEMQELLNIISDEK